MVGGHGGLGGSSPAPTLQGACLGLQTLGCGGRSPTSLGAREGADAENASWTRAPTELTGQGVCCLPGSSLAHSALCPSSPGTTPLPPTQSDLGTHIGSGRGSHFRAGSHSSSLRCGPRGRASLVGSPLHSSCVLGPRTWGGHGKLVWGRLGTDRTAGSGSQQLGGAAGTLETAGA